VTKNYKIKTDRGETTQSWYFPSRADCMACHTQAAGFVLGLNTRQMNREQTYGKIADNQLRAMDHIGVFESGGRIAPKQLEAYPEWDPSRKQKDIAVSARAYFDANCAICHCPGGEANNSLDMRFHTSLAETKLLGTPPAKGDYGPEGSKIITPGDPARSVLLTRMKTRGPGKMPPMASSVPDDRAVEVIRDWIESLKQ
jgi:mono/diheme cytochrome c family protein